MNTLESIAITLAFISGLGIGAALVLMKWNMTLTDENASLTYRIRNLSK